MMQQLIQPLLPKELVILILNDLVNVEGSSFKHMSSLRRVCKFWNNIIEDILSKSIQPLLENKLLIEYDCNALSIRGAPITYDSSKSIFIIRIDNENNDKLKIDISDIPRAPDINKEGSIRVRFHYENGSDIILFDFGTLSIHREGNTIHSKVHWNFDDCSCNFERDNNFPDSYAIQIREMTISLRKAGVLLDLLNGSVKEKHKHIIQQSVYGQYGNRNFNGPVHVQSVVNFGHMQNNSKYSPGFDKI
ncbi:hypothetical protein RclHR1_13750006 [Rhizophagus clarus]|uniref:F-box domain-containing protein n=1 Tax=Rhizophagus clarus TaxID=94130 RepID=A0A2Z6QRI1_9GLOM|nr:hypothetical protein RclHR1_13750006 [Rhizophagus clarus]GES78136.1 hypothetical protein GLOIN_2v1694631 [Rhizophagus clarus]